MWHHTFQNSPRASISDILLTLQQIDDGFFLKQVLEVKK